MKLAGRRAVDRLFIAVVLQVLAGAQASTAFGADGGALSALVLWGLCQASTVAGIAAMSAARTVAEG